MLCTYGFMDGVTFGSSGLCGVAIPWQSLMSMNASFAKCCRERWFKLPVLIVTVLSDPFTN